MTIQLQQIARVFQRDSTADRLTLLYYLANDSGENHTGWAHNIEETPGQALNFPVVDDADRSVSRSQGDDSGQLDRWPDNHHRPVADADATERFPGGWKVLKPYLLVVEQAKLPHETV